MKTKVEVRDSQEAKYLRLALADSETRALVITLGALLSLPNKRAQTRALNFVADLFELETL